MNNLSKSEKTPATPRLHVVLDTNALFTQQADKLVSSEISKLILEEAKALGAPISWYMPTSVKAERRRQMLEKAKELLGPLSKLEALLGHKLGMNEDVLALRVDEAIQRQMDSHGLVDFELDLSSVDWANLINRAFTKSPPFSPTGEKGFKDAIVLESYFQLAKSLPRSPKVCRIILLTADDLLRTAASERISDLGNTKVVSNLTELRTLFNAVASHLSQEVVDNLISRASNMFWNKDKQDGFWVKWEIYKEVIKRFPQINSFMPDGFSDVRQVSTRIRTPYFLEKNGQKVVFSTGLLFRCEAYKVLRVGVNAPEKITSGGLLGQAGLGRTTASMMNDSGALSGIIGPNTGDFNHRITTGSGLSLNSLSGLATGYPIGSLYADPTYQSLGSPYLTPTYQKVTRAGEHTVDVIWDATLTSRGNLTVPSFRDIIYRGVAWADTDVFHDAT